MRLPYIAAGLVLPPIAISLYSKHLFALYPPGPNPGRDSITTLVPKCSLDHYVDHFYGTWMLRLEAFAARLSGFPHIPGEDYAHGLFRVVSRSDPTPQGDKSLTVQWIMPGIARRSAWWLGVALPVGGTQIFSVADLEPGQSRLEYTCIEEWPEEKTGKVEWWHRLYMRMIFDQTRRNILSDWRRVLSHLE